MPYLSPEEYSEVAAILRKAGLRAAPESPLAWLSMESADDRPELSLTLWPPGKERVLAQAGYHGFPVRWLAAGHNRRLGQATRG